MGIVNSLYPKWPSLIAASEAPLDSHFPNSNGKPRNGFESKTSMGNRTLFTLNENNLKSSYEKQLI